MFVEEITIDGFKSFARRTTVAGLDPQFNAITGLNGSGKSNILDSICFVLGITNMQQVSEQLRSWRPMCSIDAVEMPRLMRGLFHQWWRRQLPVAAVS